MAKKKAALKDQLWAAAEAYDKAHIATPDSKGHVSGARLPFLEMMR